MRDNSKIEVYTGKDELYSNDIFYQLTRSEMVKILIEHGINIESKDDVNKHYS